MSTRTQPVRTQPVRTEHITAVTVGTERDQTRAAKLLEQLAGFERGDEHVTVDGADLKLSNLHKVLYPEAGFTKLDVIRYLTAVSPVLLPHLRSRALTLKRYPNGVDGQMFYQKRAPEHRPDWVVTSQPIGEQQVCYVIPEDLRTLVWVAQLADLEQHVLLATAEHPERPTAMAFDLDPGEGVDAIACCEVAVFIRDLLDELDVACWAKTSGSKGIQVYVPLNRADASFDDTKAFSRAVAELLSAQHDELVVHQQLTSLRAGKVLVDWSQNDDSKTTVCAYSLRAKAFPTASTPLLWDEVEAALEHRDAEQLRFTWDQTLARVDEHGDLFEPVLRTKQRVPKLG